MQIHGKPIDDFKSERKGIAPPLPVALRMVPILFYLSIVCGILMNGIFALQFAEATRAREDATKELSSAKADLAKVANERKALEAEVKRATDVATWIESSRPIQPLVVSITRSIAPETNIIDLRLERDPDNPAQLKLALRLTGDSTKQLDLILERIAAEKYRIYTPQQALVRGEIEYKATLVWQAGTTAESAAVTP